MGEAAHIILDFLRRHHFTSAEAAFKTELLARERGELPLSSSESVPDWEIEFRLRSLNGTDRSILNEKSSLSALQGEFCRNVTNQAEVVHDLQLDKSKFPPEKQLFVEYEPGKSEGWESQPYITEEFAFGDFRTPGESESAVGSNFSSITQDLKPPLQIGNQLLEWDDPSAAVGTVQSIAWADATHKREVFLESRLSGGFLEEKRQMSSSASGEASQTSNLEMGAQRQQLGKYEASDLISVFPATQSPRDLSKNVHDGMHRETDTKPKGLELFSNAVSYRTEQSNSYQDGSHGESSIHWKEKLTSSSDMSTKGRMQEGRKMVVDSGEGTSEVAAGIRTGLKNGLPSISPHEVVIKGPALKTSLPLSLFKSSMNDEPERWVTVQHVDLNFQAPVNRLGWTQQDSGQINDAAQALVRNGEACPSSAEVCLFPDCLESQECKTLSGSHGQEELPRLPPVRLHSMDKNVVDISKDGESNADNSTKSFESAVFKSLGSTPEASFGWATFMDGPVGQELPSSGLKRPVSRPSVSQGIVEDMSERLSGFATAGDGQSERGYPDDYCDSDTYEDDDDPGYLRQPIEDEEWFLANEIDYPSDSERGRQRSVKNSLTTYKQAGKVEEDDRSFVEEESYFSGEEYYRSQVAKEDKYRLQQSELRGQVNRPEAGYDNLCSKCNDSDLLTLPTNTEPEYANQDGASEEFTVLQSEPAWKGFMGQMNELDHGKEGLTGDRVIGPSVDDEHHGSVRSGGNVLSSDAADVGSEVRDSLLGGSSEGDVESLKDQELVAYKSTLGKFHLGGNFHEKEGRHVEVKSAPVRHLDEEEEDERDMILEYYNEAWGHTKRASEIDMANRNTFDLGSTSLDLAKTSKLTFSSSSKVVKDNGSFVFDGFSFASPSSTGDVAASRTGSGKSLWSNRDSAAQGEETDGYASGMVGPDDTLAAWKRKSNESSPIICPSEENLPNAILSNRSTVSAQSTDEYVSLEAREDDLEDPGAVQPQSCPPLPQDDEDAAAVQDEIRRLSLDEDEYEIFDLRIIHRKNRTGFEEEKDFPVVINSVIAGRYHVTEYLGSAAFSKAIQAHDLHTGMDVCMKIIKNNKDFFDQSLDEIKLLKFVNKHDPADKHHILRLYDYFYHREHLFIVCELLRANLYEFHKFNRESGGEVYFTMPRLQSITRQCLEALEFLHKLGIIHCDLKPENILVKSYSRCEIKIIDLGSSCFQTDHLCSYVQSRSYRAPEVILGLPYDEKIDMWSLGCILAELCSGNVLFQNDSLATLLARVVGILGPIDPDVLAKGRDTHKYFTKNHMLYERNQESDQLEYLLPKKTSLHHRLPMGDQGFIEFVGYLLQSNPAKRPNATEALKHPWLSYPYEPISS